MESALNALLVAVGGALAGATTAMIVAWLNRRKTKAETGQALAAGADDLVSSALAMVKELKTDLITLKQRVAELEEENRTLKAVVEAQGEVIAKLKRELEEHWTQRLLEEENAKVDG